MENCLISIKEHQFFLQVFKKIYKNNYASVLGKIINFHRNFYDFLNCKTQIKSLKFKNC